MGMIKQLLVELQYGFLEYTMRKDGAPDSEIRVTDWDDFVDAFYEGDADAAHEDAVAYWEKENGKPFPL